MKPDRRPLVALLVVVALVYGGAGLAPAGWWWPFPDIWKCTLKPHAPGCPDAPEGSR